MSNKSTFLRYLKNGEKMNNNFRRTFITTLNTSYDNSNIEKSKIKKNIKFYSYDNDNIKFNLKEELKRKLLSSEKQNYSYSNNMNNTLSTFHSTKKKFNLNLFSKLDKFSYIKNLFKNFLNSLKEKYNSLYNEFVNYLDLFSKETEIIKNSDIYQYDIFRNILEKFNKKIEISNVNLSINNAFLNIYDNLLKDYIILLTKNTNGRCTKFLNIFFVLYKNLINTNYKIYSDVIYKIEKEVDNSKDINNLLKEQILNLEQSNIDNNLQKENLNAIRNNLEDIIETQSIDIEHYKNQINELKTQITIKDYEIHSINIKLEEMKKNKNNSKIRLSLNDENFNDNTSFYEEKLDYDYLLKNRLERIRFQKFKQNVISNYNNNNLDKNKSSST
jgi:hypothetical protein